MPGRILRVKRVRKISRLHKAGPRNVTRAEFKSLIRALDERGQIVNDLRRELHAVCEALETQIHQVKRDVQTQFTRMAQIQQEIDALKRRT